MLSLYPQFCKKKQLVVYLTWNCFYTSDYQLPRLHTSWWRPERFLEVCIMWLTRCCMISTCFKIFQRFFQGRKRLNASAYELAWSVIRRLLVCLISVLFALTIHLLSVCHWLTPASVAYWFNKRHAMCYHARVIMHVNDPSNLSSE